LIWKVLQKSFQKLSNQVVDLKRVAEEGSSNKGTYRTPYRRPQNLPSKQTPSVEGLSLEGLHNAIQALLAGAENTFDDTTEQQTKAKNEGEDVHDEEDSSPPTIGHFSDSIFQANYETVHENQQPYYTHSKDQSSSQPRPVPNKTTTSNQKSGRSTK
jgi:hypothetical protein